MGYEVISNGSSGYTTTGLIDIICWGGLGCIDINLGCESECPPVDSFCVNPGIGCRNGCGGATGESCVEPYGVF